MGYSKTNEPKNDFVPIPSAEAKVQRAQRPTTHETLPVDRSTGHLELEIDVLSPLHVGAGWFDEHTDGLAKATILRRGRPIVPGTSIKGACRQLHEALTASGSPFEAGQGLSKACANGLSATLFGALGWKGRVSFDDAVLGDEGARLEVRTVRVPHAPLGGWPQKRLPEPPPRERQGRRFYGAFLDAGPSRGSGRVLAIPARTTLHTRLRFRNVESFELGSVLVALGADVGGESFTPKLGGCKYEPLGWVRYRPVAAVLRTGLGAWRRSEDRSFWREAIEAAERNFANDDGWHTVLAKCREHMQFDRDRAVST